MQRARQLLMGLGFLAALGLASATPAQQPPPPKPASEQEKPKPPAKKAKKVWTGEDLKDLRTPADAHAEKKAAEEAAAKEAAEKEKKAGEQTETQAAEQKPEENAFNAPTTVAEAEQRIAEKYEEIEFQEEKIRQTREQYFAERDDRIRAELEKQIERMNADLEEARAELALLEKTLKDLKAKAPAAPPAKSPGQP